MHTNAIETWLARMHKHAGDTGRPLDWRFFVELEEPGLLETTYPPCRELVIRTPYRLSAWWRFFSAFHEVCKRERFDVVHMHADVMSAPYLIAATLAGVRHKVVHVHNADESVPVGSVTKQRLLREPLRRICLRLADRIAANSNHALDTFLAGRPRRPGRDLVHYYGIDPRPFQESIDRAALRQTLGLSDDALILLFAGRMVREKNPVFAVDVLAELRTMEPRVVGVFAGSGALEDAVRRRVEERGLQDATRLLGWRSDVTALMGASDWFILTRPDDPRVDRREGFGVAVVEAQLAGLRLLLSRAISPDPLLPTASVRQLSLAAGPRAWAKAAMALLAEPAPIAQAAADAHLRSPMNLDRALEGLIALHA